MVKAVRGAVQIEADDKNEVTAVVREMISEIISENEIDKADIVSIFFTATVDIRSTNPAAALRSGGGFEDTPLFCAQEPDTEGAMPRVVRVLVTCNNIEAGQNIKHIYKGGAEKLRPDLN